MNVANGEQLMIVLNLYIYKSKNHCNPRHIHIPIQISEIYIYIYIWLRFACQQRVLKTFPGPGYFLSEDGVV